MKQKLRLSFFLLFLVGGQQVHATDAARVGSNVGNPDLAAFFQAVENVAVKGKVVSAEDGEPLPGVTILIKGSANGVITDFEGNYSMMVPKGTVLVFSYVGYNTEEFAVGDQSTINIELVPDLKQLDEVVVTGYGEQKRANLTGSVVTISGEEIKDLPVANLSEALIGRLPGVTVGQSTGKPGAANPLTIRRGTSLTVPEVVLYVIDGVIYEYEGVEQFNRLDPSEIESISFLKDGAAAVYGARASGGVVLVKTKRGKIGKPRISYSTSLGVTSPTQLPEMLSSRQHATLLNEMYDYENGKYRNDPNFERNKRRDLRYFGEDELNALDTLNSNWLDGLYQNGVTTRHTLNISGGTENVRYFAGGSYYKETGNIDNLQYQRYSFRANLDTDITKDVTFSVGLSTNQGRSKEPYYSEESSPGVLGDTYKRLLTAPGWVPPTIYDPLTQRDLPVFVGGTWNPYGLMESNNYRSSNSNNTTITGALNYTVPFVKGLTAKTQLSFNENAGRGNTFAQDYYAYNFQRQGSNKHLFTSDLTTSNARQTIGNREALQESTNQRRFYQFNASLNYNRTFGPHNIEALLVYEQAENTSNSYYVRKNVASIKGYDQLWAFSNNGIEVGSGAGEGGNLASIGRLNYNFKEKYLFETSFRYEASQKFHPDNAWGFFPNISGGWVISEENFIRNTDIFVDFLKLRASFGRIGNDNVPPFIWKPQYGANEVGPIFGSTLTNAIDVKREGIAIPSITWQKNDVYNVGIDTRFFDHRVNMSMDAYYRYTTDILTSRSNYPVTTGINKPPQENYGISYAKGLEFQLGYKDKIGNDFEYSFSGNLSWNYSRPLKLFQNPAVIGRWDDRLLNDNSNQPGWIAGGIIRNQEDLDYVLSMYDSISGQPVQMGMIWYKDIRGENYSDGPDGKLDTWDRDIIAEYTSAPYNYGFTLGAGWKGLRVSGTFSGAFGHKVLINKDEQVLPTENDNVFAFWGDYWTPENPDAAMPRPYQFGLMEQHSTFWMRDGNTLRLNNINVSYALPAEVLKRVNLPQFRFYFSGTNIWTIISPYDHKDPAVSRAYDYPLVKTYNFGLNVNF